MSITIQFDGDMANPLKNLKGIAIVMTLQVLCMRLTNAYGETEKLRDLPEDLDFYSFPAVDIFDNIVSLEQYRGKVSLVVNVASQCGYTENHYRGLTLLQEIFSETKKFNVLAFPCNQFGDQEPGTLKDIHHFAYNTMGANFPLFAKINVLEQDIPPAWTYLMKHSGHVPTWNFWKYLVNDKGHVLGAWGPSTSPETLYQQIREAIDAIDDDNNTEKDNNVEADNKNKHKTEDVKDEF